MSLKAFHIIFIIVSTTLSVGVGAWGIHHYLHTGAGGDLALGVLGIVGALALLFYSRRFLRLAKDISYL